MARAAKKQKYVVTRTNIFVPDGSGATPWSTRKVREGEVVELSAADAKHWNKAKCLAPFIPDDEPEEESIMDDDEDHENVDYSESGPDVAV